MDKPVNGSVLKAFIAVGGLCLASGSTIIVWDPMISGFDETGVLDMDRFLASIIESSMTMKVGIPLTFAGVCLLLVGALGWATRVVQQWEAGWKNQ